jgi:hypothetical protein
LNPARCSSFEPLCKPVRLSCASASLSSSLGSGAQGIDRPARRPRGRLRRRCRRGRALHHLAAALRERAGGPDRLRFLVRDGDLHRDLRARRGRDRLRAAEVPRRPGRRLRRAARPRPHRARDLVDGRAGGARDRDLDRQRGRAREERAPAECLCRRGRSAQAARRRRDGATVRLAVQVPRSSCGSARRT